MNERTPILGVAITWSGTIVAWLPEINMIAQTIAATIAIIVGLKTLHKMFKDDHKHKK